MFLTAKEFAAQTGLSYRAVLDLLHAGRLPFLMCGNRHKIPRDRGMAALNEMADLKKEAE